ncbi:MAG: 50S ribosomal protein L37ae [Methanotrichaceae archaeon]
MVNPTRKGRKSRSAARFGPRYGRKSRKLVADMEEKTKALYDCPQCGRTKVRRISSAIWSCAKCGYTYAGGTFVPETSLGRSVVRSLKRSLEAE